MKCFRLEYDSDYGVYRRAGWTIVWDGQIVAELEPWLIVAVFKAWRRVRAWS
jgi:hypothetical protein